MRVRLAGGSEAQNMPPQVFTSGIVSRFGEVIGFWTRSTTACQPRRKVIAVVLCLQAVVPSDSGKKFFTRINPYDGELFI